MAMNAMTNAQLWHSRLGYLNKRSLEFMQRHYGNGVTFDGSIDHCDVCAVGKSRQLAHPKKAKHADITAPFQLVYGDLTGAILNPRLVKAESTRARSPINLTNGPQSTCSAPRIKPSRRYSYSSLQPSFRSAAVSSLGEPIRAVNTPAKTSKRIARRRASLSSLRLRTRQNNSAFRNALDGHCSRWSGACVSTAGYRHFFG